MSRCTSDREGRKRKTGVTGVVLRHYEAVVVWPCPDRLSLSALAAQGTARGEPHRPLQPAPCGARVSPGGDDLTRVYRWIPPADAWKR